MRDVWSEAQRAIVEALCGGNNSRNLIKTTGTPIDLRVDLEDYDRCFDLLNDV